MILSEDDLTALKSMAKYWKEVKQRDDKGQVSTILHDEGQRVMTALGPRKILDIIEDYIKE